MFMINIQRWLMSYSDNFETDPSDVKKWVTKFIDKYQAGLEAKRNDADFLWKVQSYPK